MTLAESTDLPSPPADAESPATETATETGPPSHDRYERPSLLWYLLLDSGVVAVTVLSFSATAYDTAAARVPLPPRRIVQAFAAGTLVAHVGEAAVAHRMAKAAGMHRTARRWTIETFVVGFPSLLKLRDVARS